MNVLVGREMLVIALLLLGLTAHRGAFAQTSQSAPQEAVAVSDTVLALTKSYVEAWESLDQERILRFHSDDVQYYWMGSGSVTSNTAFAGLLGMILPRLKSWSVKVREPRVKVLGTDAAVVSFLFDFESVTRDGQRESGRQAATYVFERRNDDWKIVVIHESAPAPKRN